MLVVVINLLVVVLVMQLQLFSAEGQQQMQNTTVKPTNGTNSGETKQGYSLTFYLIILGSASAVFLIFVFIGICFVRARRRKMAAANVAHDYEYPTVKKHTNEDLDDDDEEDYTNVSDYTETVKQSSKHYDTLKNNPSDAEVDSSYEVPVLQGEIYKNLSFTDYENAEAIRTHEMYQVPNYNPTGIDEEDHYVEFHE